MTVQELIDQLKKIKNKELEVVIEYNDGDSPFDTQLFFPDFPWVEEAWLIDNIVTTSNPREFIENYHNRSDAPENWTRRSLKGFRPNIDKIVRIAMGEGIAKFDFDEGEE